MNATVSSQYFSGRRFVAALRRDWRMNRDGWAVRVLAMLGVMALLETGLAWFVHKVVATDEAYSLGAAVAERTALSFLCLMCFSVFLMLGASRFHSGYGTPGMRLNELMNPASTLEKFVVRMLTCIVGVTLATALCWEVSDFLRGTMMRLWFGSASVADHVSVIDAISNLHLELTGATTFTLASLFGWQGVYALGSCFFPKHSFLKTMGAVCVVEFVYGMAAGFSTSMFFDPEGRQLNEHLSLSDFSWMPDAVTVFFVCLAVGSYALCYMRMREDEMIDRM